MVKTPNQVIATTPRRSSTTRSSTGLKQQDCAVKTMMTKRRCKTSAGKTSSDHSKVNV
jgi:hypothetical protein